MTKHIISLPSCTMGSSSRLTRTAYFESGISIYSSAYASFRLLPIVAFVRWFFEMCDIPATPRILLPLTYEKVTQTIYLDSHPGATSW